jgi:hypothetical protein
MRRPRILVLAFSDLSRDPRVDRQIRFLSERYDVIAAGWAAPTVEDVRFVPLTRPERRSFTGRLRSSARLLLRKYEEYYWSKREVVDALERLAEERAELVLANDLDSLPLALRIARDAPVLFDAHEFAPLEFEDRWSERLLLQPYRFYLCRRYVPRVAAMTTVGATIATAFERLTGVRPEVIWNAPERADLLPKEPARSEPLRLVHHGIALRSRGIDALIRMMPHLDDRFELNLVLAGGDPRYLDQLRRKARGNPRIRFPPPVPMRQLASFLNRFDLGVYLLAPVSFNNRFALPNKFFEFVQARLALAIGPSPEMATLVREYDLGYVADDFSPGSLARLLRSTDHLKVKHFKQQAHRAAGPLSADRARQTLFELTARIARVAT